MFYRKYGKRMFDLIISICGLIALAPVFLVVAILVKFKLGSPVIFKQPRPGLDEKIFNMYKFRTMTNEIDESGNLLSDEIRLTPFGKILRATSIDEIPELINIIKGEMSIVGPRPQLVLDLLFMSQEQKKRHMVLPGLTGLAQIKGRNNISWEDKFSLDLEYINGISILLDIKILFITIHKVFARNDVNTDGMETSENLGDYLLRTGKISESEYCRLISKLEFDYK